MKSRLKLIVPLVALAVAGAGYKFVVAKPAPAKPKAKIEGVVTVLPKEFLINLQAGGIAKLTVGMVLEHMPEPPEGKEEKEPAKPPEGYAGLHQEAVARAVITDVLTDSRREQYMAHEGREKLKKRIVKALKKQTDLDVEEVLFSDVIVQ